MSESWVPVYSTTELYQAEIIRQFLADNQIASFVLNQKDSNYLFGDVQLCVKPSDVIRAKHILKNIDL